MALVLNTNSYVSVDDADTYLDTRIDSANWTSAAEAVKEQALVTATHLIDDNIWIGYAVSSSQSLAWPRKGANYYDSRLGQTIEIAENVTPDLVKRAVYEQALWLVDNEDVLNGTSQTFESISVGSISLTDSNGTPSKKGNVSNIATKIVKPLLKLGAGASGRSWWRAN